MSSAFATHIHSRAPNASAKHMSHVLLIVDTPQTEPIAAAALAELHIAPVRLSLEDFDPDFLLAEMFDLIVIELFGENSSCIAILQRLESMAQTSGIDHPPIIVVTSSESNTIEQALRTAKVCFLLLRPLQKEELISAIRQALRSAPR